MKQKLIFSIFIIFFSSLIFNSVFAQNIVESEKSEILVDEPLVVNQNTENYIQQERISTVLLVVSLIASLMIGIFLMVIMIKKSPKIPNIIIHGLVFLGSFIWFVFMIFSLFFQLIQYGEILDPDIIELGWPSILLLIFSGYLTFNLIKKQNFAEKMKYALSLSSGWILASVLAILSMIVLAYIFSWDGLGVALFGILLFTIGAIGSVILGIIGLVIDKSHK